ncbi:hypothetical protein BaRGS_00035362 [Batillaria attramentaria]|uniref:DUF885 domain-containing protein n=1 Tax=Batillaria attramentaria TaxID=370345 RepID=A0ABD0JEV5_9CAEN
MTESADTQAEALCAEVWAWRLAESPELATYCGIHDTDDQLDDISEEAYIKRENAVQAFLKKAEAIDVSECTSYKQSLLLLKDQLQEYLKGAAFKSYYFPISFLEGVHIELIQGIHFMKFDTVENFETYVARLTRLPKRIEQVQQMLEKGIEAEMVMHRYSVEEVPNQLDKLISVPIEEHPFMKPFMAEDKKVSDEDLQRIKTQAMDVVTSLIVPAFQKLKVFIEDVYFRSLRPSECAASLPHGLSMYQQCLNFHLSCEMSPKEVHELGLREVDRIYQCMKDLARKEGFDHIFDFVKHVKRKDEGMFKTPDEVLDYVKDLCHNKIHPKVQEMFQNMPGSELKVLPTPPEMFSSPAGFYYAGTPDGSRPGLYYINNNKLELVRRFMLTALSLHEGEPGHHLQSEYSLREKGLPDFRRYTEDSKYYLAPHKFSFNTAYIEGWGLYCEALGEEMGVYEDSESLLGRYTFEIFRAARLVVDTGIHAFGWSQYKAVEFIKDHTQMDHEAIVNEVNRFITWPGQACAYKIGELKLWELRHKAEKELGENFKLAEFHERILKCGPVPLRFLESIVEEYIKENRGPEPPQEDSTVDGPTEKTELPENDAVTECEDASYWK